MKLFDKIKSSCLGKSLKKIEPQPVLPVKKRRQQVFEKHVDIVSSKILEIGALNDPTYSRPAVNIFYMDWFSKKELYTNFKNNSPDRVKNLVEVDFIIKEKKFEKQLPQDFDAVIANHVIEHIPDMIGWFKSVSAVLKDRGMLFLSVPHKNYTFDILRPLTTLGQLIDNNDRDLSSPDFKYVFDHIYLHRPVKASDVWAGIFNEKLNIKRCTAKQAVDRTRRELTEKEYVDVHCNIFDYESFIEVSYDLISSGLIDLKLIDSKDVEEPGNEFIAVFEKQTPLCK